jgi:phage terminase large subunit GpA-like protein
VRQWERIREHNHFLDCRNYARAGAAMLGLDRMDETDWLEREKRYGKATDEPTPAVDTPAPQQVPEQPTVTHPRKKRPAKWFRK